MPRRGSVAGDPGLPHHLSDADVLERLAGSYENGDMTGRGEEVTAATGAMPDAVGSTAAHPGASAASCWTAKRLQLLDWFRRSAPQLAQVYAGAVTMASDGDFPGRVVFVWHAIREIRNRLPDALAGEVASSSLEYRISPMRSNSVGSRTAGPTTARSPRPTHRNPRPVDQRGTRYHASFSSPWQAL